MARQHFETGDYGAARAILDAEQMRGELDALLRVKEQLHQRQAENETRLIDKANEFLILARLTAVDFALPGCFEKTAEYFEQSFKAAHTLENTFEYAYFLQQHNQFNAALPRYEAALGIYRTVAESNPQTNLPDVATTLSNLAVLRKDKNQFPEAEAAYQEALGIYRTLAESNPQTYLPDVATTLNNCTTAARRRAAARHARHPPVRTPGNAQRRDPGALRRVRHDRMPVPRLRASSRTGVRCARRGGHGRSEARYRSYVRIVSELEA